MKRISFGIAAFLLGTLALTAQPPGGGDKGGKEGGKGGGMRGGYGKVIPGFMIEQLKLSDEQKKAVEALEADVKAKLDKILTDDQKKILETPRGPGGPGGEGGRGKGGPGGDKGGKGGPGGDKGGPKPEGKPKN